jgi:hypothetical protein
MLSAPIDRPTDLPADWDEVRARGRAVHLLARGGAGYPELVRIAHGDVAVIVAAIAYEGDARADRAAMTRETVQFRLQGLLGQMTAGPTRPAVDPPPFPPPSVT